MKGATPSYISLSTGHIQLTHGIEHIYTLNFKHVVMVTVVY